MGSSVVIIQRDFVVPLGPVLRGACHGPKSTVLARPAPSRGHHSSVGRQSSLADLQGAYLRHLPEASWAGARGREQRKESLHRIVPFQRATGWNGPGTVPERPRTDCGLCMTMRKIRQEKPSKMRVRPATGQTLSRRYCTPHRWLRSSLPSR